MRLADELATRLLPIERSEGAYARNRPHSERPPWPKVGWQVWYRRNEWDIDEDLHRMRVVAVQDPGDQISDWAPNLWEVIRDNQTGQPLVTPEGGPLVVPVADPWPWVHLRWEGKIPKGGEHAWKTNIQMTFESRVRGGAGWLPIDYETTRKVRLPGELVMQSLATPVRPATAGFVQPNRAGGSSWSSR